jgi:poly(ADP-ribose) glycohydrolase ARH3
MFHGDLDRVWEEAGKSAAVTHGHPLGIEGAQLLATAVALATRGDGADHDLLFWELHSRATQEEYQWLLRTAAKLGPADSLGYLGSSLEAHRSVVTAIACFAVATESYPKAIARALALGDDTDTVMAMTGAISGAHLGIEAVPAALVELVENEGKGREYVRELAGRLWEKTFNAK